MMSPHVEVAGKGKVTLTVLGDACTPEALEERAGAAAARVCLWGEEGGHG